MVWSECLLILGINICKWPWIYNVLNFDLFISNDTMSKYHLHNKIKNTKCVNYKRSIPNMTNTENS